MAEPILSYMKNPKIPVDWKKKDQGGYKTKKILNDKEEEGADGIPIERDLSTETRMVVKW